MEKMLIDKIEIPLKEKEFVNANILKVTVGTSGWQQKGSKWDCKTFFEISDEACTVMKANVDKDPDGDVRSVGIFLEGETELITFVQALEYAAKTLREMSNCSPKWFEDNEEQEQS